VPSKHLRVVDYVANLGGGVRFCVESIRALISQRDVSVELVSYDTGLANYQELLSGVERVEFVDMPPHNLARIRGLAGFKGAGRINSLLGMPQFHFEVPVAAFDDCEVLWVPWLHRHRIPWSRQDRVVASLHDLILLQFPGLLDERRRRNEHETVRKWLASSARIVVSSETTAQSLGRMFGCGRDRVGMIPLSGQHSRPRKAERKVEWPFSGKPYLFCPSNTTRHKNHEVLFAGAAGSGIPYPLVLTGGGTDFWTSISPRSIELRQCAEKCRLEWNRSLFGLGYVTDASYYDLLQNAWAVVIPTLAEGGGSFPVAEALEAGIPVIASDIPVMREWVGRLAGQVLWFDPSSGDALAATMVELNRSYRMHKEAAVEQVRTLRTRSWADVAKDYAAVMNI
jgi:glycosyltransferase involved in cell wall biosynthesis